jgi:TPR repeat protein
MLLLFRAILDLGQVAASSGASQGALLMPLRIVVGLLLAVITAGVAMAGPIEDATAAHKRGDYAMALRLLQPLAEQGDPVAQFNVGVMYDNGESVPQNDAEAITWFRKSAQQGVSVAQFNLGVMYDNGEGVPQDYPEAAKWYRKAADQGVSAAQFNLGIMYHYGEGVAQDNVLAHMWLSFAAATGNTYALKKRDAIAKLMTPHQLAEAQRMAREWKPKLER